MLVALWNFLKAGWSRANDQIMRGAGRRPIGPFGSPEAVGNYAMARFKYRSDLGNGAFDNYTHPERIQYGMETGDWGNMPADCDDLALWAYQALKTVPGCSPYIVTLRDAGVVGSHVVCAYRQGSTCGVIDTNGHRLLTDLTSATLCRVFTEVYARLGYRYVEAAITPYPF
ncbi:MAG: hypothetical protein KA744_01155 [Phenylobacterium sp.]|nr:hypothetical protein [Phenylobacterium sp.]